MVDSILFSAVLGLLTKGIPAAVTTLKLRYEQTKATKEETLELENFLYDLHDCAIQYQTSYGGTLNATTTTITTSSFVKELEDAQKTLDQWSSQHHGFFSRSPGERLRKLQALRKKVDRAMKAEILRMTAEILGIVKYWPPNSQNPMIPPTSKFEVPRLSQPTSITTTMDKNSKYITSGQASISSTLPPPISSSSSISVERHQHDSSYGVKKIHKIKLWAPFDSEKQSNAIEIKLKDLLDVKNVFFNPENRQVRVELREGSKVGADKLINEIKRALSREKRAMPPRLWSDW